MLTSLKSFTKRPFSVFHFLKVSLFFHFCFQCVLRSWFILLVSFFFFFLKRHDQRIWSCLLQVFPVFFNFGVRISVFLSHIIFIVVCAYQLINSFSVVFIEMFFLKSYCPFSPLFRMQLILFICFSN